MADKRVPLFVDNSNVNIEGGRWAFGKRNAGVRRGPQVDDTCEIDRCKFLHLVKNRGIRFHAQVPVLWGLSEFLCARPRRLVHGGGRRLRRTNDAVGKSVAPCYAAVLMKRSP